MNSQLKSAVTYMHVTDFGNGGKQTSLFPYATESKISINLVTEKLFSAVCGNTWR